jgi:hypothetical protein
MANFVDALLPTSPTSGNKLHLFSSASPGCQMEFFYVLWTEMERMYLYTRVQRF